MHGQAPVHASACRVHVHCLVSQHLPVGGHPQDVRAKQAADTGSVVISRAFRPPDSGKYQPKYSNEGSCGAGCCAFFHTSVW